MSLRNFERNIIAEKYSRTLAGAYYDTFWSNIGAWNADPHVSDLGVHVWEGKHRL